MRTIEQIIGESYELKDLFKRSPEFNKAIHLIADGNNEVKIIANLCKIIHLESNDTKQWISVKKQFPIIYTTVVFAIKVGDTRDGYKYTRRSGYWTGDGFEIDGLDSFAPDAITHWHQILDPPDITLI